MAVLVKYVSSDGVLIGYRMNCPGCGLHHVIFSEKSDGVPSPWTFNGDLEKPTVTPSLKVTMGDDNPYCCHFVITDGMVSFCSDSSHSFANKTVPMLPIPCD